MGSLLALTRQAMKEGTVIMGMRVEIYRNGPANQNTLLKERSVVVLTNVKGPFEPQGDDWAAVLVANRYGDPVIVPDMPWLHENGYWESVPATEGFAHGGAFAFTSDARFARALEDLGVHGYCAVPVHDHSFTLEGAR